MAYSNQPKSLDSALKEYLKKLPGHRELKRGMVLHLWPQVVGERVEKATDEIRFEGGRLIVTVINEAWRHEIHMNRYSIQKKLNSRVGSNIVKEILIRC